MSYCKDLCFRPRPCFPDLCPEPCVSARNDLCITSCGDSTAVICPPSVSVHFPGPILATNSQESIVGSTLPAISYGTRGPYGGSILGDSIGYGGGYGGGYESGYGSGYGGGYGSGYGSGYGGGYGGLCSYGSSYGYGGLFGYGRRYGRKCYSSRHGNCGPC